MTETNRPRSPRLILFNVCVGLFMVAVDQRVLLVALPTLTRTFNTDLTTIQWTLLIYDLTLIGLVITVGRIGDLFGRKRIYMAGFLLFIFGSALCGLSQSPAQLILFRCLQAIGGAMLTANGRAIVSTVFPAEERGKALGYTSVALHTGFPYRSHAGRFSYRFARLALDLLPESSGRYFRRLPGMEDDGGNRRRRKGRRQD